MTTITASEGGWLTQATPIDDSERIMVRSVSGMSDNLADEWREAAPSEYEAWAARQAAAAAAANPDNILGGG